MTEIKETQAVEPLDRNKKIYVAGHRGLVGSGTGALSSESRI